MSSKTLSYSLNYNLIYNIINIIERIGVSMKKSRLIFMLFLFIIFICPSKAATFLEASTQRPVVGSDVYILLNAMYGDLEISEFNVRIKYDTQYLKYERPYWIQGNGTVTEKDGYLYIKKPSTSRNWTSGNQMQFKFTVLKEGVSRLEISAVDETGNVVESYYSDGNPVAQSFAGVTINAVKPSTDTTIGSLFVEGYNMSPTFSKTTYEYTLNVPSNVTQVNVVAKKGDNNQTITGTGKINLNYGQNRVRVIVKAQDGSSRTYQIMITRADDRTGDTSLQSLNVSNTSIKYQNGVNSYEATVSRSIDNVLITAITTDPNATLIGTGKKQLNIGNNTFTITVVSSQGQQASYTININRSNEELEVITQSNKLKSLKVNTLYFNLNEEKKYYLLSIPKEQTSLNIEAIAESASAKVEITGNANFNYGLNLVTIKVTETNNEKKEYNIVVYRQPNDALNIPTLTTSINSNILYETTQDSSHLISKDLLQILASNHYTLYYDVVDLYNGLLYQVTLNNNLKDEDLDVSINKISDSPYLTYETNLPSGTDVLLYLDEKYLDGASVSIYSYNEPNHYTLLTDGIKVNNGYIEFTTNDQSHYVITTSDLLGRQSIIKTFLNRYRNIIIMGVVILILCLIIIKFVKKKQKQKNQNEPLY